jgi:hypothetical protein
MRLRQWAIHGFGLGLLLLEGSGAIASELAVASFGFKQEADPPTVTESLEPELFETFTLPNHYSVLMPRGWFAAGDETTGHTVITSYAPATDIADTDIKTEMTLVDETPETYVDRELDNLIQSGYTIDRFGIASIQGNDAFRIWIVETLGDFKYQVITFVGYDQGVTAKLVSYYSDNSRDTVETVLALHRSFNLVPTATGSSTPEL